MGTLPECTYLYEIIQLNSKKMQRLHTFMYHVQASQSIPEIYIIFWYFKALYTLLYQINPFWD